jgi:hypothetical protein
MCAQNVKAGVTYNNQVALNYPRKTKFKLYQQNLIHHPGTETVNTTPNSINSDFNKIDYN